MDDQREAEIAPLERAEFRSGYRHAMLTPIMDSAINIMGGADMGNIQLFEPASRALRIQMAAESAPKC